MGSNIILALGALVVFGMVLTSSNRLMTGNTQIAEQNEYYITGISIGQSIIDEAKTKAFDEKTAGLTMPVNFASVLTLPGKLGPEISLHSCERVPSPDTALTTLPYSPSNPGFRSAASFNDVDDYNGYQRLVNTQRAEGYKVLVSVSYASEMSPDSIRSTQTFCKVMTVKVTSPYFRIVDSSATNPKRAQDTVKLSYAFTY